MLALVQMIQHARIERIDTGIDMAFDYRFFLEADDVHAARAHHSEGMLPFVQTHCHCRHRAVVVMEVQQLTVMNIRQHIAVGDDQRHVRLRLQ